jgi:RNA polymerase sigma-70 factor (ECF subfamily)
MIIMIADEHLYLVQGLMAGSHTDFDRLYAIYADPLYNFAIRLTKSPAEAKDILQDTFLRLWQMRETISTDKSFKSFIFAIARNLIIDSLRKQVSNVAFEEYLLSPAYQSYSENDVDNRIYFDEFLEKMKLAKRKLSNRQKEIVELSMEKGYSVDLIAKKLNISPKTVKNQLSLAVKILRTELSPYYYLLYFILHVV